MVSLPPTIPPGAPSGGEPSALESPPVLVIDDEPSLLRYFEYNIKRLGYRVHLGASITDMFRILQEESFAMILLDLMLPEGDALAFLPDIVEAYPSTSVVLVSAHGTIPKAVTAIKQGAVNFLQKPVSPEQLERVIIQAIELWRLKRENRELRRRLDPVSEFHGMIGQSEPMQEIYRQIELVSATSAPVMITGESGTGKELVAHAIHACSSRSQKPFIAINCAAIPHDLLESEIFGHERGAFTGAIDQYRGCFERADKGTLFLDEIGEMDIGLQAKLLRLIQEQSFYRIGGSTLIRVNVRIIAATNRDPLRMVEEGKFREDLYYRLNVLPVHLPPLRERRDDIGLIATRHLQKTAQEHGKAFRHIDLQALAALEAHQWSGNIRELQNVIEQIIVLHEGEKLTLTMLPDAVRQRPVPPAGRRIGDPRLEGGNETPRPVEPADLRPFWQVERDEIQRALDVCRGNVQEVARRLEISPATLYRKIEKFGLEK